jgi:Uma2 family endonuclease
MVEPEMGAKLALEQLMNVEEFLAFTASRPQEERWELIEGQPVMNPSPTNWHQIIAGNIFAALAVLKNQRHASWTPLLGIGTRVPISAHNLPQPDVLVQERPVTGDPTPVTDDALVVFEVLSKSNTKADQAWRRRVYSSVPNCQHYVTVAQTALAARRYDRAAGWEAMEVDRLDGVLALPALGDQTAIPLADIYRWTPLAPPA